MVSEPLYPQLGTVLPYPMSSMDLGYLKTFITTELCLVWLGSEVLIWIPPHPPNKNLCKIDFSYREQDMK